jgi:hypothetical protein
MPAVYPALVVGFSGFIGGAFIGAWVATPTEIMIRAGLDMPPRLRERMFYQTPMMPAVRGFLIMLVVCAIGFFGAIAIMRIGGVDRPVGNQAWVFFAMLLTGLGIAKLGRYRFWISRMRR